MANIKRALAEVQQLAESQGLKIVQERGYLILKAQGRDTSGGQTVLANEDGIGYLKMILDTQRTSARAAANSRRAAGGCITEVVFAFSFLAMFVASIIGTFSPESRGITGPLTILFIVLVVLSAYKLIFGRARK